MLVVLIQINVKPECLGAFLQATIANAKESLKEPGIAQFDLLRQADAPNRFVLVEAYRTADGQARHRETPHYLTWRETVAPMMAEPRVPVKFDSVYPPEEEW